jgi:hypothetical protein
MGFVIERHDINFFLTTAANELAQRKRWKMLAAKTRSVAWNDGE